MNLLILFGALQGLLFAILLAINKTHPGARFLCAFMIILAYNGVETFNWSSHLDQYFLFFDYFPFVLIFGLGPSLYLYIASLLKPGTRFTRSTILMHYSMMIFQLVFRMFIMLLYVLGKNKIVTDNSLFHSLYSFYHAYSEPLSLAVFVFYLALSFQLYKSSSPTALAGISRQKQAEKLTWVRALLICMAFLSVFWFLTVVVPVLIDFPYDSAYYPVELCLVFFIYWIAIAGFHKTRTIFLPNNSGGSANKQIFEQLLSAIEKEKVYLMPDLTLAAMSKHTGFSARSISMSINRYSGRNFNDFINDYRVKEVCTRLAEAQSDRLTIWGIALESGFSSQATFQRAFRAHTGMSPREYQHQFVKKTGKLKLIS